MRYIKLYRNKWLDTIPDKLYSDGVDENNNILFDNYRYPEEFRDVYYTNNKNYKDDMSNESLFHGFHHIVFSETNPNIGA